MADIGELSYQSRHTGEQIDDAVNAVSGLSSSFTILQKKCEDIDNLLADAQMHNGLFRAKKLNTEDIDDIQLNVSQGDFSGLETGNYFTAHISTMLPGASSPTEEDVDLMIGDFNYYYNVGDIALTKPHLVLIPRTGLKTASEMNDTNTTAGGYVRSYMNSILLPCYAASFKVAFNDHLLKYRDILTNEINATVASGWEWTDVEIELMNEVQVFGTRVFSSSAYDVGTGNRQISVFKFINPVQYGRSNFWLRSVASATTFAHCNGYGVANENPASNANYVRPFVLFG